MAFKKGVSGNPAGRTAGKTPAAELKKIIAESMPDILQVMIEQALQGDMVACKALADKIIPNLKSQSAPVTIPAKKSLTEQGASVIKQTLSGNISTDSGNNLMAMLSAQGKLIELQDLVSRIEQLEAKQ